MNECVRAHVAVGTGSDCHKGLKGVNHRNATSKMRVHGQMEGEEWEAGLLLRQRKQQSERHGGWGENI